ncbi:putative retrotransposon hot spot protein (RHS) [Trypanosoma cruzi]|uniref:Putative retrotransposon hot spot protein (RHS) n=1 Tax=Trypanosoma cruzi TaxID=5693 RepID=A0A2V2WJ78_TRYCR|nr:putative retrotransposon hot spot protein (RHS) [Trypanosoma cruzi]
MQHEGQRRGTLLPCTPQIFSIKHASYTLFCCVGDYRDASLLWSVCVILGVAVAAPNLLFILCVRGYVTTSSCKVCAVTAVPHGCGTVASGMRGRTLRAHHVVVVCSHQHCAGWMAPTFRRCSGPRACGVPSQNVSDSLFLAASHFCECCFPLIIILVVG